ncbi:MAG TPA: glycogen synthase [Steroidobacteraceae bacterium]|nr:glycogen synthase [Steroidobacteraceae bacterium]
MKITFVASEITPFAKTGGLADVAAALPQALHTLGHDLRVFMPFYSSMAAKKYDIKVIDSIRNVGLMFGQHHYEFSLLSAKPPGSSLDIYLIDCPALYSRSSIYTYEPDEHRRFLMLQRAALESCQRMQFAPDILHCNDWHTSLLPLMIKTSYGWDRLFQKTRSVLSIHNIGYQGQFAANTLGDIGIGDIIAHMYSPDLATGHINWMREGIRHAHAVSTVSPTYAREICTPANSYGMDDSLRARSNGVTGILNGVDYDSWNPETDKLLPARFTATSLAGKQRCKKALIERGKLHIDTDTPIVGLVSRLAAQKGIDLLFDSLLQLLTTRDFALCILGSGELHYVDFFKSLAVQFPDRVYFENGYDESLAHLIEAGSDMFLMPSLYEPCGLNQMYSLKYGTVPIVRKTGGLADSVQLWDGQTGTGIVFDHYDVPAVLWAINTALDLYKMKDVWLQIVQNGMAKNFSWAQQAKEYVSLYEETRRV